jgi:hypothetical protein
MALSLPTMPAATSMQMTLTYDASRLRLVAVHEAAAERNAATAARFSGDADGPGSVHVELTAGRGESLPTAGGALAEVQFEVLETPGLTQVSVASSRFVTTDSGEQILPAPAPVSLEIKAAQ